jgi:hypothetical protein
MDQEHREWLEDKGADQLAREAAGIPSLIGKKSVVRLIESSEAEAEFYVGPNGEWLSITLRQAGQRIAQFSMDMPVAVRFANAILSEVEIALRDLETCPVCGQADNCGDCDHTPCEGGTE